MTEHEAYTLIRNLYRKQVSARINSISPIDTARMLASYESEIRFNRTHHSERAALTAELVEEFRLTKAILRAYPKVCIGYRYNPDTREFETV